MKEIYEDIYQVEIPLLNNPLKAINSYFIIGEEECLVIDTGFNAPECRKALLDGLDELNIPLGNVKLFVTHLHSDHSGLAAELNKLGVEIYTG
ncbi:MAG: MBL fold metallo-hydrolase, partial [Bacillota bacterium]|nr:MBL fold metallo-hydrolase [Bacillota bacterium]